MMKPTIRDQQADGRQSDGNFDWRSDTYAWYVVALLTTAFTLSMVDRMILSLLIEPIKQDLGLTDTQMSLLHGFAFSVLFIVLGVVFGRLADTKSRRAIGGISVFLWSCMTVAAAWATNFIQLFITRVGVGVGEAGLGPSANSLISNYFPRDRMAKPIAVYSLGAYAGTGLALIFGGAIVSFVTGQKTVDMPLVGEIYSWQAAFILAGLPGILLSLFFFTVKEPPRQNTAATAGASVAMSEVLSYITARLDYFRWHIAGICFVAMYFVGGAAWLPTFYIRSFGWSAGDVGLVLGCVIAVTGVAGVYAAGTWVEWLVNAKGKDDGAIHVAFQSTVIGTAPAILSFLSETPWLAFTFQGVATFFLSMPLALSPALLHSITPGDMRGQVYAIYMVFLSLFGYALGPTLVALVTDYVFQNEQMLNFSMALVASVALPIAAGCLWAARKPYARRLQEFQSKYS